MSSKKLPLLITFVIALAAAASAQTGGIKGKVHTMSGSGIPNPSITARQNGADIKSVKGDAKGAFVLNGLDAGKYNIVFDAPGYSSGVLYNVEVQKKKTSDLGERLILTRDQGEMIIVKGSVFFKEGHSVTGAKIEVEQINSDGSTKKLGSTTTSVSGEFTFRPATAGKLKITASYKGVSSSKEIEVSDPAIYRLAISLDVPATEK
ncbi:MAG TPA: carboxypeptidase-like regulatory domain-containing protein [Pyrinomonadaceae bacterium]